MQKSQIKIGILLSYILLSISTLANLLLTPFLLKNLGQSEFGLYSLIGAFVSYITILDFGLGNTVVKYVAMYRARNDKKGQENFLAITLSFYIIIGILTFIIGLLLYNKIEVLFGNSLTHLEIERAKIMYMVLLINIIISFPLNFFQAIISSYEHFIVQRFLSIIRVIFRTILLIFLLSIGYKSISIVILDTVINLGICIFYAMYVFKKLKIKLKFSKLDKKYLKEIFSFSFFIFLSMIVDQIYWKIDQVILGVMTSATIIAVYVIGIQLVSYFMQFSTAIASVFLPKVSKLVELNASGEDLTNLMIRTGRIQFAVLSLVLSGFIIFGRSFVVLWAGVDYWKAYTVALIVMIPLTIPLVQNIGISILQAKNMHRFKAIMNLGIAILNIGLTIIMVDKYGMIGAALSTGTSYVIGNVLLINLYYHFKVGLNIPRFFKELFKGLLSSNLLVLVIGAIILYIIDINSWSDLLLYGALYFGVFAITIWFFGLNNYEKGLIKSPIGYIYKRFNKVTN